MKPKYTECKFARYFESQTNYDDVVVLKLRHFFEDGSSKDELRLLENIERPYWITKPHKRTYKDKKEWCKEEDLQKFKSTQRNLAMDIQRKLGRTPDPKMNYPMVCNSPYVYGADVTTPVLVKNKYDRRLESMGVTPSKLKIAVYDFETDVVHGTEEIITGVVATLEECYIYYTDLFEGSETDLIDRVAERYNELLGEYESFSNLKVVKTTKLKTAGEVAYEVIQRGHDIKPDLMCAWNMKFDVNKMLDVLTKEGYDLADTFSDPSIPVKYRYFKWTEAKPRRTTASGKVISKHMADLWHVVEAPSSFYFIDAMCLYKLLRVAKGMEASYSLDYILGRNNLDGKLKFSKANHVDGLDWHKLMSTKYKAEYLAYNIRDCLAILELDAKTNDMSTVFMLLCSHSEWHRFTSTPRRLADDMHFRCLEKGLVQGTTANNMEDENDAMILDMSDWIVTLPNDRIHRDSYIDIFNDPAIKTNIVIHGYDSDVVSAYPKTGITCNISKENTVTEVCEIEGLDRLETRKVTLGMVNALGDPVTIVQRVYDLPGIFEMEDSCF